MKINYKIKGSASDWAVLMDTAQGHTIEPWKPHYSAHQNIQELASNRGQGASVFTDTLGNIRCQLGLTNMNIVYGDAAAALTASRVLPNTFLNSVIHLQVIESNGSTPEKQYFPNCVFSSIEPDVQGANVNYNMQLTSQMVTDTEPS